MPKERLNEAYRRVWRGKKNINQGPIMTRNKIDGFWTKRSRNSALQRARTSPDRPEIAQRGLTEVESNHVREAQASTEG
jgi:hypothetical protein